MFRWNGRKFTIAVLGLLISTTTLVLANTDYDITIMAEGFVEGVNSAELRTAISNRVSSQYLEDSSHIVLGSSPEISEDGSAEVLQEFSRRKVGSLTRSLISNNINANNLKSSDIYVSFENICCERARENLGAVSIDFNSDINANMHIAPNGQSTSSKSYIQTFGDFYASSTHNPDQGESSVENEDADEFEDTANYYQQSPFIYWNSIEFVQFPQESGINVDSYMANLNIYFNEQDFMLSDAAYDFESFIINEDIEFKSEMTFMSFDI